MILDAIFSFGAPMRPYCAAIVALCLFCSQALAADARRPNIIVFLVDDMGWMDCGAYGSKYYETPNIDRFATRAMRFNSAYAQPLCSPTRCSLLTGKYSARHGITSASGHQPPQPAGHKFLPEMAAPGQPMLTPESKNYMEPGEYTLAEALHDAGYRTAHIGKWHLGLTRPYWPEQQGFDVAFHCHPDPGPPGFYFSPYNVKSDGEPRGQTRVGTITDGRSGEYIVDRLADEAVKFIAGNRNRPFFLNLWNYGVHGPWGHKEAYTRAFADKKDPRGEQGNPIMASMLRSVDECFGKILEALDRNGLTENTIVIFNSDNGGNVHSNTLEDAEKKNKAETPQLADWRKWAGTQPPTNNTPLRNGKASLYEGGTRVPLMWAWAGHIRGGSTNDTVVGHIDLYPTLLEVVGVPQPTQQKVDGVSYASVLKGTGPLNRQAFFNYFPHGQSPGRAGGVWVRSGDWKLIRWFGIAAGDPARLELYNLRDDLSEKNNLASTQPERVGQLDRLIDGFLTDTGATYPRPNPAYVAAAAKTSTPGPATGTDLLEGWKARQCEALVANGVLTMTASGKGAAFLGHGLGKSAGPAEVRLRVRSNAGGAGKIECLPGGASDPNPAETVAFNVAKGDWQALTVNLSTSGPLGVVRLYLPATLAPLELDWVELKPKTGRAQRWEFDSEAKTK
jgi:arylsulfatase A-like enzyme